MTLVNRGVLGSNLGIDVTFAVARCFNSEVGARFGEVPLTGWITVSSDRIEQSSW